MNQNIEKQIFEYLSQHLSSKKVEHSYNVSMLAVKIALKNDTNLLKARIASLLHDCAKFMSDEELVKFFRGHQSIKYFREIVNFSPQLLHSFASEIIARKNFKIKDRDILNAIKYHTLGRENMSVLEKIVFVADSVSLDRHWRRSAEIKKLAKNSLNVAFFEVLKEKIGYVVKNGNWLCQQTICTWNWYVSNIKKSS
ncbi:MAG: bis(5'-nucleosyl)-tetraphosphatase (symmetrical) YqeK [Endomicrobium sp.]|jgi:predicted HD superfamily hydrolase involved in NAD metabolism|nr:bis(5'-nucleosyl)-tetraphosphatase (symmetrical) YqeK [Endomicrobium sp.]